MDVDVEMTSKRENNHIRGFAMQQFGNDSSIVLLAHLTPAILLFMFFSKLQTCAILIFKVRMIPKLKNNHFSLFVMLKLVEKDPSFVLGECGHFGNHALAELADIFKKGIGAHFSLKCCR